MSLGKISFRSSIFVLDETIAQQFIKKEKNPRWMDNRNKIGKLIDKKISAL